MKNFYYLAVALMAAVFFVSCSDSDDNGSQGGNGDKARTDVVDYTVCSTAVVVQIWMVTPSGTGVAP